MKEDIFSKYSNKVLEGFKRSIDDHIKFGDIDIKIKDESGGHKTGEYIDFINTVFKEIGPLMNNFNFGEVCINEHSYIYKPKRNKSKKSF